MSDWSSGYVADVAYTYGYYAELNPLRARLALLASGFVCPEFYTACELGFGQGLSANIHAAASKIKWYGTDFNPAQAAFAQDLARAAGTDAKLYDESFLDFADRKDIPEFDYIGLHGIWSWISDENRKVIVEFIRRKLKVGGVLYVSYNTLPGWAEFAPIRHLMAEHAEVIGSEGRGIVSRINDAMDFAENLLATNPTFSRANPSIAERIRKLKAQNRHYIAHEYFNRDWHPMHFSTMADWLEPAKLQFACSANYLDHVDVLNLSGEQQQFLSEIPDRMFRASVRDFMVNQQFRRDFWVKGLRSCNALEQAEALRGMKVVLTTPRVDVSLKTNGPVGEMTLSGEVYNPILDFLADHSVRSIAEIEVAIAKNNVGFAQLTQAVILLTGLGYLSAVYLQPSENTLSHTERLNVHLFKKARTDNEIGYLASPLTGGGVFASRFQQLFIMAITQGKKQPQEWAEFAWNIVKSQGQRLLKEGKPLEGSEENLAELKTQAEQFAMKQLPIYRSLGIV